MTVERIKQYVLNRLKLLNEVGEEADDAGRHELLLIARLICPENVQSPEGENPKGPRYL